MQSVPPAQRRTSALVPDDPARHIGTRDSSAPAAPSNPSRPALPVTSSARHRPTATPSREATVSEDTSSPTPADARADRTGGESGAPHSAEPTAPSAAALGRPGPSRASVAGSTCERDSVESVPNGDVPDDAARPAPPGEPSSSDPVPGDSSRATDEVVRPGRRVPQPPWGSAPTQSARSNPPDHADESARAVSDPGSDEPDSRPPRPESDSRPGDRAPKSGPLPQHAAAPDAPNSAISRPGHAATDLAHRLADSIASARTRPHETARLSLRVDEFGDVHLRLTFEGDRVHVRIEVAEPSAVPILNACLKDLANSLHRHELRLVQLDVGLQTAHDDAGAGANQHRAPFREWTAPAFVHWRARRPAREPSEPTSILNALA
ncbi:MAG: flagellar hook-length control protein FliK [Armatimonadota bacterium]